MKKPIILDESQIDYLFNFVRSKYVRYIDVQHELVDHLASAIEDEMEKDEKLSFHQALDRVYSSFPITGFAAIISAKEKSLNKYWWKITVKYLLEFITLPKIVLTCTLYYTLSVFIEEFGRSALIGACSILVALSIMLFYQYYKFFQFLENKQSYLFINAFEGSCKINSFTWCYFLWMAINSCTSPLSSLAVYLLSAVITISIIYFYASYFVFPVMLRKEVNQKYQHLNLKFA